MNNALTSGITAALCWFDKAEASVVLPTALGPSKQRIIAEPILATVLTMQALTCAAAFCYSGRESSVGRRFAFRTNRRAFASKRSNRAALLGSLAWPSRQHPQKVSAKWTLPCRTSLALLAKNGSKSDSRTCSSTHVAIAARVSWSALEPHFSTSGQIASGSVSELAQRDRRLPACVFVRRGQVLVGALKHRGDRFPWLRQLSISDN